MYVRLDTRGSQCGDGHEQCESASLKSAFHLFLTSGASNSRPPGRHIQTNGTGVGDTCWLPDSGADIDAMSAKDLATVDPKPTQKFGPRPPCRPRSQRSPAPVSGHHPSKLSTYRATRATPDSMYTAN